MPLASSHGEEVGVPCWGRGGWTNPDLQRCPYAYPSARCRRTQYLALIPSCLPTRNEPDARTAARPTCTPAVLRGAGTTARDRKSTRLNSSHPSISYAVFCLKKKKQNKK